MEEDKQKLFKLNSNRQNGLKNGTQYYMLIAIDFLQIISLFISIIPMQ